jgi:polysaccharide biosynthesis protein PelC
MQARKLNRLALAALLATMACTSQAGRNYHDSGMDFGSVRTVIVLPFANLSRDGVAADRVREAFSAALLATGAVYVVPQGEVARAIARVSLSSPTAPSAEEVVKLCQLVKADAVMVGVVREYGEVRSGAAVGNVLSLSIQLEEAATGKVVWTATSTKGGLSFWDRLIGSGGTPMNPVTESAVDDLIAKLFK